MTCPKITRCGHIFCWPCIENYYNYWTVTSINKKNPKCPLCKELIVPKELKICEVNNCMNYLDSQTSNNYNEVNSDCITFNLIMKEKKGQVLYNIFHDPDLSTFKNEYYNNKNINSNLNSNSNTNPNNINTNHHKDNCVNNNNQNLNNLSKNVNNKGFSSSFGFIPLEKNEEFSYSRIFITNKTLILKRLNEMKNILEINLQEELNISSMISSLNSATESASLSSIGIYGEAEDLRRINSLTKCLEFLSYDLDYYFKYKEKDKDNDKEKEKGKESSNKILQKNKQIATKINIDLEINRKKSSFYEKEKEKDKEKDKDKDKDKDKEQEKEQDKDKDKEKEQEKDKENDDDNKKIFLTQNQNSNQKLNQNQNQHSENTSTNDYDSLKTNFINLNENQENEIDLKNFLFFYQENKGDIYFLHPLNHSILMKEYECEDDLPTQICVRNLKILIKFY
jgi:hypothetical protein